MIPNFRAWLKKEKEMIDVDEIHWYRGKFEFIGDGITFQRLADEVELMQSTGLKDKDGKEIFEGDILGSKDGILDGVVEFRSDLGMWTTSLIRYNNFERLCNVARDREIIGNIWGDGDLIDGKKTSEN